MRRFIAIGLLSLAAPLAHAQLGLPGVRVPLNVPQVMGLNRTLQQVDSRLITPVVSDARNVATRTLIRSNRTTLEADPNGAAIRRGEILALSLSDGDLATAQAAGFGLVSVRVLDGLNTRIVVLQSPQGQSTVRALAQLRALIPGGSFDFNHLYSPSGEVSESSAPPAAVPGTESPRSVPVRLGLIDGGVDGAHPVFHDSTLHRHGCGEVPVPSEHGTAVASLMVGRSTDFHGAAPGAELYASDVYCGVPTGGSTDAVAEALAWLVHERVAVINVSLVGPSNVVLAAVVHEVLARGFIIVAAVGNDGPAAPPLYPASYPGVVGVTAVDARHHVLIEAARGPQVRFAAPGADMVAAKSPQGLSAVRGTSFAAPLVTCLLGTKLSAPDVAGAARVINELAARAVDLGSHGLDQVYGYGLVAGDLGPDIRLAGLHTR